MKDNPLLNKLINIFKINWHKNKLASYDLLTELPNRYLFEEILKKSLLRTKKKQSLSVLFYINIDNFKDVNDLHGTRMGDIFLKKVGNSLLEYVNKKDHVARLSGDEFGVIVEDIQNVDKAMLLAQSIVDDLHKPFVVNEKVSLSSVSIGIAIYPNERNSVMHIMQQANNALYQAKNAGGNCYKFYNKGTHATLERYVEIVSHLRNAIQKNQFELCYQPQIGTNSSKLIGIEALLRWNNPTLNNPEPTEFIPIAEEAGLISEIGAWVITNALKQYNVWYNHKSKLKDVRISINISPYQLDDKMIIGVVSEVLKKISIPTKNILFELTESAVLRKIDSKSIFHKFLAEVGIGLSIDDFGTGYSSFTYLKQLPIKEVKIDKSFIVDIGFNPNSESIIKAIISLAKALELDVVAEGVDTKEQLDFLQKNQCGIIQGYYFSKPLSVTDIEKFIG